MARAIPQVTAGTLLKLTYHLMDPVTLPLPLLLLLIGPLDTEDGFYRPEEHSIDSLEDKGPQSIYGSKTCSLPLLATLKATLVQRKLLVTTPALTATDRSLWWDVSLRASGRWI